MAGNSSAPPSRLNPLWLGLAITWLFGFLVWFNSFELPNGAPFRRTDIWQLLILGSDEQPSKTSSWSNLPERLDLLGIAAVIWIGAVALGRLVLRSLKVGASLTRIERLVFSLALGLSGLSLLTLGAGLAGLLNRWLLGGCLVGFVLAEVVWCWRSKDLAVSLELPRAPADRRLKWACVVGMLPFVAVMLLGAMLPPTDFDVKEYHLQGPKEFFQNGRVGFLPHNVYTSFPFLTEMLSLLAMVLRDDWFRGALAGKVVLMGFAPLTGLALYAAGRRFFSETVGWLAALVFLTTPWTYRVSIIAYAEGGLTCFLFVSTLAAMIAMREMKAESGERKADEWRWLLLTGLLAGSAMACKYPGVVQVVIPIGLLLVIARYRTCGCAIRMLKAGGVFTVGVLITIGPWLVKNTVETGNPVYPLLWSVFGGTDWDAEMNAKWRAGHSPDNHAPSDLAEKFVDVIAKSDWQSGLLFALAPLALLALITSTPASLWFGLPTGPPGGPQVSSSASGDLRSGHVRGQETRAQHILTPAGSARRDVLLLWAFVTYLFLIWWTLTHRIDRFWMPMIPVVALLAGVGLTWTRHRVWVSVASLAVIATLAYNLQFASTRLCGYNAYLADLKTARTQSELATPGLILVNQLPKDSKVLCVGEAAVFDARREVVYNTVFDRSIFQDWLTNGRFGQENREYPLKPAAEIRQTLKEHGITHIFVNWAEVRRYRSTYGYTDFVTPERFEQLQSLGILGDPVLTDERGIFVVYPVIQEN